MARVGIISIVLLLGLCCPLLSSGTVYKVLDEDGNPLIGATIKLVYEDNPTVLVSDINGEFEYTVKKGQRIKCTISYIGCVPETFVLTNTDSNKHFKLRTDPSSLDEVVITATRTPKALKDVPVVTKVISAEDIAKADATNIQDLLTEELPGLEFGYAMNQETSLNMNGFGGNAVLFLVDGERLAGETMDNVDYNRLNLDNVGRVEIVKGASSALYGANAVGGVVNLITRENNEPWRATVNSRYRTAGKEWRSGADISFNAGKWNSNTNLQYVTVDRIELASPFDTESKIHEIFGGRTLNAKERLTFRASDNVRVIARGGYFDRISDRITYKDHYKDYSAGLRSVIDFSPQQTLELSYSFDQYDKARFVGNTRTHDHDYSNRQNIAHVLYTHFFGANGLTLGGDYMNDYLTTYQFLDNTSHSQNSADVFAQFDYNPLKWLNLIGSVRYDYFSASKKNAATARFATMFKLPLMSIRVSYSGGFRAPSLKEMYMNFDMAGIQMIYGNPNLKPERSHNLNLALERNGQVRSGIFNGSYSLTLLGYYNYYNSRITTTDAPANIYGEDGAVYCNEDGVRVSGVDVTVRYRTLMGFGISGSYNYLHTGGNTVDSQFTQPRPHSATWRLDYDKQICNFYRLYVGVSGRYLSKPVSKHETDSAYSLWKFTLQQQFSKGINLNFVIDNLFGYKPKIYYWNSAPTIGRTYSIGMSLDIDSLFKI